jgi:hypothetical protein
MKPAVLLHTHRRAKAGGACLRHGTRAAPCTRIPPGTPLQRRARFLHTTQEFS